MTQVRDSVVLVVGATGTVGSAAVSSLLAQGARVRVLVRSRLDPSRFPGVEVAAGDLRDEDAVKNAVNGAGAAFYVSPHEPEEERIAEIFVRACEASGARLVFAGVHLEAPTRLGRAFRRWLFGRFLPHYAPKFRIGERARTSRANPVVLVPTNFFQNDELFREELLGGRFVQPFARPVNRIDVRDIGDAAARACLDPSLPSGAYPLVGPESLDGNACAAAWSNALGRPVAFDDAGFESAVTRELHGKKRADFAASYAAIRKLTLATRAEELARTSVLLGRPPLSYAAYVHDTASRWRARVARAV
ncbi:MAG TPA: NmrA family NAD(P)-binding protein [Polyangiaceae bacterium]